MLGCLRDSTWVHLRVLEVGWGLYSGESVDSD